MPGSHTPTIGLTRGLWYDRARYLESYWSRLPDLWVHGDFASVGAIMARHPEVQCWLTVGDLAVPED